jgi:hypothetical protein
MVRFPRAATWPAAVLAALLHGAAVGAEPPAGTDYYPLADGARWEFASRYEVRSQPDAPARTGRRVDAISGSEEVAGHTYLRFSSTLEGIGDSPVTGRSLLRAAPDGIYARTDATAPETLVLPLPPSVGRSWTWQDGWGSWTGKIERQLAVETPAGRFDDCIEVTVELATGAAGARGGVHRRWDYCRGVGAVRQVTTTEMPGPAAPIVAVTEEELTRSEPAAASR